MPCDMSKPNKGSNKLPNTESSSPPVQDEKDGSSRVSSGQGASSNVNASSSDLSAPSTAAAAKKSVNNVDKEITKASNPPGGKGATTSKTAVSTVTAETPTSVPPTETAAGGDSSATAKWTAIVLNGGSGSSQDTLFHSWQKICSGCVQVFRHGFNYEQTFFSPLLLLTREKKTLVCLSCLIVLYCDWKNHYAHVKNITKKRKTLSPLQIAKPTEQWKDLCLFSSISYSIEQRNPAVHVTLM